MHYLGGMNKLLLSLTLITISGFAFYQQKKNDQNLWRLTIADSVTAKGIENATIVIGKSKNLITDGKGAISIKKNDINPNDDIEISSIGYQTTVLTPDVIHKFPDTIWLSESVTLLKEVKINPSKSTGIILGSPNKSHDTPMHPNVNDEFAEYMPNEKKITGTITSVEYELNDDLHGIEMPFNVELLSRSKDSIFPDTALMTDSIIVYNPQKKRHFIADISSHHIQIPENGFFVVFQTLSQSYYSKETVSVDGHEHLKMPGINIYLKEKNQFEGECCDANPPIRKGFYCLLTEKRQKWKSFVKTDQWIVYGEGINFAITATINPN